MLPTDLCTTKHDAKLGARSLDGFMRVGLITFTHTTIKDVMSDFSGGLSFHALIPPSEGSAGRLRRGIVLHAALGIQC